MNKSDRDYLIKLLDESSASTQRLLDEIKKSQKENNERIKEVLSHI